MFGNVIQAIPAPLRGVFFMLVSTLLFTGMQVTVRHVADELHPFEIAFFRNFFGLLVVTPLLFQYGFGVLRTPKLKLHALRGALQTTGMMFFFTALTLAPLAQNIALSFTAPLFATVLAILLLGERAGWRRWVALIAGFVGAWIVIRPGFAVVNTGALLVILSSCVWAGSMVIIKILSRTESSLTITLYMGLFMAPLSLIPALFVWQWPSGEAFIWLALVGAFGGVGHLALAQAFKESDATAVLPFDFMRLIWASALGFLVFAEIPDIWTWIGGAVIFSSTVYIAFREARQKKDGTAVRPVES
ncbi:MAG: DMT family transporter [Alphaproteobacteria bacterium]